MTISMHGMAVNTFAPMLENLSGILDIAAAHAEASGVDLLGARLAPDMFAFTRQVQIACDHAKNGVARLAGKTPVAIADTETTFAELKARIAATIALVKAADPADFVGAEAREITIPIPRSDNELAMDGMQFLTAWALPNFYFHLVTAYDILRHNGVAIGKSNFVSRSAMVIRPRA